MIDELCLQLPPLKMNCPGCGQRFDLTEVGPGRAIACPDCGCEIKTPWQFSVYQLFELLHKSEHASIYHAKDPALERELAVKILHPYRVEARAVPQKEKFYYSAQVSALLNQPGVARMYSAGEESNMPYLVLELLTNRTLAEQGKENPDFDQERLLRNLTSIAEALNAAAEIEIGHHELWYGNLLLDSDDRVKIINFRPPPAPLDEPVIPDENCLFVRYLSPERLTGGEESLTSDVYSLGVMAYELFSGVHPFELCDLGEMIDSQYGNSFVSLSRREPNLDGDLAALIDRMMNCNSFERPDYPQIVEVFTTALKKMIEARTSQGLFSRLRQYLPDLEFRDE